MLDNQRPAPGETAGPLRLRPARPGDAAAIAGMLAGLSGRSIYLRYLLPRPGLPPALAWREAERLVAGGDGRGAMVALLPGSDGERLVGIGEYAPDGREPGVAEVALVVADAWQRRGIGRALASALVEALGARGIATLQAVTLLENAGIRRLFARSPQPYTARFDGGMLIYRMGLGASMR